MKDQHRQVAVARSLGAIDPELRPVVEPAAQMILDTADDPFRSWPELGAKHGVEPATLRRVVTAAGRSAEIRSLVRTGGLGSKYWRNTVIPLLNAGALEAVLLRRSLHPQRVGLYVGPSCMFTCTFCGRNPEARYPSSSIATGNEMLKEVIEQAPPEDPHRFYISGGLEPLTNPGLGAIIDHGAALGYSVDLYTNGFSLTRRRADSLMRAGSVRISLYGPDEETYEQVTRKRGAFQRVTDNLAGFLEYRSTAGKGPRVGLNYVILPTNMETLDQVAKLIVEINRRGQGAGIDFVTLREDFTPGPGAQVVTGSQRAVLGAKLAEFDAIVEVGSPFPVRTDLGYGLWAISQGASSVQLQLAGDDELRPSGHPQVSVVVDLLGDVYLYREAGFLDRPGATRYILGRVSGGLSLQDVVDEFVSSGGGIDPASGDSAYLDSFDHAVTLFLRRLEDDRTAGFGVDDLPV